MTYKLIVPIETGTNTIDTLIFHKPTLGELTKVKGEGFEQALDMLACCTNQSKVILKLISYEDSVELMENILPNFLGLG